MMAMVDLEHDPLNPVLFAKTGAATLRKEAAQAASAETSEIWRQYPSSSVCKAPQPTSAEISEI